MLETIGWSTHILLSDDTNATMTIGAYSIDMLIAHTAHTHIQNSWELRQ